MLNKRSPVIAKMPRVVQCRHRPIHTITLSQNHPGSVGHRGVFDEEQLAWSEILLLRPSWLLKDFTAPTSLASVFYIFSMDQETSMSHHPIS